MHQTSAADDAPTRPATAADAPTATPQRTGLATLLFVSISFGLAFGTYEVFLPLFWRAQGMQLKTMGYIFAIAAVGVFVLRVYAGRLSDAFGRKPFYTLSLCVAGLAQLVTPLLPNVLLQAVLKTSREASAMVREAMHSVLLYESRPGKFMGALGVTRGAEFTCQGLGSLAGAILILISTSSGASPNYTVAFVFSAVLIFAATAAFAGIYRATGPSAEPGGKVHSLRQLFSADLPPKLWLLVAFGFVFEAGLFTTHCFVMPIYFRSMLVDSFRLDEVQAMFGTAAILAIHRVLAGVPMMLVGPRLRTRLKALFIGFVFCEGVAIAATPFIPNPWIAIAVWLTHDLLGAGIWWPIHNHYIQLHSRPESRGADVSKVLGLSQLGRVAGPLLAGVLGGISVGFYAGSGPFLVGGIVIALSALILLRI